MTATIHVCNCGAHHTGTFHVCRRNGKLILGTVDEWAESAYRWETGTRTPADSFEAFAFAMFKAMDEEKQTCL